MTEILFHVTADGSPFGKALCGFIPEPGEGIWVTQIASAVNCVVCRDLAPGGAA